MSALLAAAGGALVGFAAGLLTMGAAAAGKVDDAERLLDEAGRESDERRDWGASS